MKNVKVQVRPTTVEELTEVFNRYTGGWHKGNKIVLGKDYEYILDKVYDAELTFYEDGDGKWQRDGLKMPDGGYWNHKAFVILKEYHEKKFNEKFDELLK